MTSSSSCSSFELKGMDWLQDNVVKVLNDLYDPAQVARGMMLAKLRKTTSGDKKKKKNKKQDAADATTAPNNTNVLNAEEQSISLDESSILALADEAASEAAPSFSRKDAMVTYATRRDRGDYQVNAALGLSSALGLNPRECARQIADALPVGSVFEPAEIAGPGFINFRFRTEYLQEAVRAMAGEARGRLAVPQTRHPQRIVVDFSSPNIAKEMHVGHLRSTIIGDSIANLLEFCGHEVIRLNHVGDWGTQFGMLVEHLRDEYPEALTVPEGGKMKGVDLGDLVVLYKAAKKRFDEDEEFRARARRGVVKLQAGNPEEKAAWEALCAASRVEYQKIYDMLNIRNLRERGESFYNPYLPGVVEELEKLGLAVESDGAKVVFLDAYANRDGSSFPMIVRKSDGGFNYATTDLAAIRQRTLLPRDDGGEEADRVLYVTDAGQSQHFEMVFSVAKRAGFCPSSCSLEHVPFGLVQGEDGKKFATRSGETVKLKDLLEESIRIAGADWRERNQRLLVDDDDGEWERRANFVSRIVGIGAVKYADLSMNRESNYRFSYQRMLSLNGNTAPYMLYAYARICGIVRKAAQHAQELLGGPEKEGDTTNGSPNSALEWPTGPVSEILVTHETESDLMRKLVKLPDVLRDVESDLYPHKICDYLFETSQLFNQFYENCSVLQAETPQLRASRLSLCMATAGTIRLLLQILGMEVVEKL